MAFMLVFLLTFCYYNMPGLQLGSPSAFSQLRVFVASVICYLKLTLAVQTYIKSWGCTLCSHCLLSDRSLTCCYFLTYTVWVDIFEGLKFREYQYQADFKNFEDFNFASRALQYIYRVRAVQCTRGDREQLER